MPGEEEQEWIKQAAKNEFEWNESEFKETVWDYLERLEGRQIWKKLELESM